MPSLPKAAAGSPLDPSSGESSPGRELQRLDEQKRWFLRMTSHELRTPLNSIIGFSEILAREQSVQPGSPQYREYAGHILASGQKLLRLVNQLIEMGRLQNMAAELEPVSEPLDHVIDDVIDTLADQIAARGQRVVVEGQGALPSALADPAAVRTIVNNLIDNAITFGPEGGEVRVRAIRRGGKVELEIEDDGPGLNAADVPRLLRPFEQGEDALNRANGGAGLGLAVVKMLARSMQGGLRLVCEPGCGLKAVVTLPAG
jgi:signal transduction histidine kinase